MMEKDSMFSDPEPCLSETDRGTSCKPTLRLKTMPSFSLVHTYQCHVYHRQVYTVLLDLKKKNASSDERVCVRVFFARTPNPSSMPSKHDIKHDGANRTYKNSNTQLKVRTSRLLIAFKTVRNPLVSDGVSLHYTPSIRYDNTSTPATYCIKHAPSRDIYFEVYVYLLTWWSSWR